MEGALHSLEHYQGPYERRRIMVLVALEVLGHRISKVEDEEERKLGLPSGEYEVPIVIQDRSFDAGHQLVYLTHMMERMTGFHGDRVLINKYGGTEVKLEEEKYTIVREEDILGVIA